MSSVFIKIFTLFHVIFFESKNPRFFILFADPGGRGLACSLRILPADPGGRGRPAPWGKGSQDGRGVISPTTPEKNKKGKKFTLKGVDTVQCMWYYVSEEGLIGAFRD